MSYAKKRDEPQGTLEREEKKELHLPQAPPRPREGSADHMGTRALSEGMEKAARRKKTHMRALIPRRAALFKPRPIKRYN
jgi:hypothetical protein